MVAVELIGNDPRDHHIVTAGYLRRFARAGKVTVHRRGEEPVDKGVRAVAYVRDFWRSPELAEQVEAKLGKGESAALNILRQLEARWPLRGQDRLIVATFLAIHMVRLPAFGGFMRQVWGVRTAPWWPRARLPTTSTSSSRPRSPRSCVGRSTM